MHRHALTTLVVLAGCEGGSVPEIVLYDAPGPGRACTSSCNPLTQTGCNKGEKCTWMLSDGDFCDHLGCAPEADAPRPIGASCTWMAPPFSTAWDDCVEGAICVNGVCEQVCDLNGGVPVCEMGFTCRAESDLFEYSGNAVAGRCARPLPGR